MMLLATAPAPGLGVTHEATLAQFAFHGSALGASIADWRAKAPPQPASTCGPTGAQQHLFRCLMPDVPIGEHYRTRGLTYTFVDQKLVSISFAAPVDAFDGVVAVLRAENGPPGAIVRDSVKLPDGLAFPHVRMTWRRPGATIVLSDPGPHGVQLFVTLSADPAPSRNPGGAAPASHALASS